MKVTLGEYNLREPEKPASVPTGVRNIVIHPDHKCGKYVDDIAILELESPISWTNSVQPACLPTAQGEKGYQGFGGLSAIAAGWGWLGEDKSKRKFKVVSLIIQHGYYSNWENCFIYRW